MAGGMLVWDAGSRMMRIEADGDAAFWGCGAPFGSSEFGRRDLVFTHEAPAVPACGLRKRGRGWVGACRGGCLIGLRGAYEGGCRTNAGMPAARERLVAALAAVAAKAEDSEVFGVVGAAGGDGDDVVDFESYAAVAGGFAAAGAAVDQGPFAGLADGNGDGLHGLAAGAAAISRLFIQVSRPEAARAVVAVARAGSGGGDDGVARDAGE